MIDMIRVGPAAPGSTPFFKDDAGGVEFNGQNHRMMEYGHSFDAVRGYRVYFKFQDSIASNTWKGESLLEWLSFTPKDDDQRHLQKIGRRLARQVIRMNREWERLGKPEGGIPMNTEGSA